MSVFRYLFVFCLFSGAAASGASWWWLKQPLALSDRTVELSIEPGTSPREVAKGWVAAGVKTPDWLLYQWFRWSGQASKIRAGSYEIDATTTPRSLLDKMVRGDALMVSVRLIEGWTFRQWRAELAKAPGLQSTIGPLSDSQVLMALGEAARWPEGQFYPDTYNYTKGSKDVEVLKRAHRAMKQRVAQAWAARDTRVQLRNEAELLILASIIEKETGAAAERKQVAAVFANRLRLGMPLQTDPTVIYGLGEAFDGNLRKVDLLTDTPYNTYTRKGLPPTPISMPGKASLMAAAQPASSNALYFVARGDGTSVFSQTLAEHNQAVNKYQRQR